MVKDAVATTSNATGNRDLKGKGRALGPSQTLYTPVFYTPSPPVAGMSGIHGKSPSTSSSKPGRDTKGKAKGKSSKARPRRELERVKDHVHLPNLSSANLKRLEELSKRHIALSSNAIPEIPDSQPSSPSPSSSRSALHQNDTSDTYLKQTKKAEPKHDLDMKNPDPLLAQDLINGLEPTIALNPQIRTLRYKLFEALQNTSYDPSHGNWASLSTLLRLGVTSGGTRWVGARADGSSLDIRRELEKRGGVGTVSVGERGRKRRGGLDWCNAETEEEWFEWEKMFEKEMALKRRVEEWTKGVVEDASGVGVPEFGLESQLHPPFSREEDEERDGVVETSEFVEKVLEGGEATTVHEEQSSPAVPVTVALAKEERAKQARQAAKNIKEKKAVDPLRGTNNVLGFSMAKKTAASAATARANHKGLPRPPPRPDLHPQTSPSKSSPSKGSPSKHRLLGQTLKEKEAKEREEREKKEKREKEERKKQRKELISDLSDITSFPAPSFPESQLVTSTPPALPRRGHGLPPPPPFPAQAQLDTGAGASSNVPAFSGGFPGFTSGFNTDPLAFTSGFNNAPRTPKSPGKSAATSRPTSPHKPLSSLAKPLFPVSPRSPGKGQAAARTADVTTALLRPVELKAKNVGAEGVPQVLQEPPTTPPPVRRTYGKSPLRTSLSLSVVGSPVMQPKSPSPAAGRKRKLSVDEGEEGDCVKRARLEPEGEGEDVVMENTTPRKVSLSSHAPSHGFFGSQQDTSVDTSAAGKGQNGLQNPASMLSVPAYGFINAISVPNESSSPIPGLARRKEALGEEGAGASLPTLTDLLASAKKGSKTRGGKLKRRKSARMGLLDVSPVKEPRSPGERQSGMLSAEKKEGSGVVVEEEDSLFAGLPQPPAKTSEEREKAKEDGQGQLPTQEAKQTGPTSTQSMLYGPGASRSPLVSPRSPVRGRSSMVGGEGGLGTTPRTPTKSVSHVRSFQTPRTPKTPTRTPRTPNKAAASMSMSQVSPARSPRTPKGAGGSMSQPVLKTPGTNKAQKTPGTGKTPRNSMSLSASLPPGLGLGGAAPTSPLGMKVPGFTGLGMKKGVAMAGAPEAERVEKEANRDGDDGDKVDPLDLSLPPIDSTPDPYNDPSFDDVDPEDIYVPGLDDDYGGLGLAYGYNGAYGVGGVYDDDGEGGTTDLESPTKSLSSLAGSDSDSDSDFDDDDELPQGHEEEEAGEAGEGVMGGGRDGRGFRFEPDVVSTQKEEQMRLAGFMPPPSSSSNPFLDSSLRLPTEPLALLQQYQSQSQFSQSQAESQERGGGWSPNKPLMSLQSSQPQSQSPDKLASQNRLTRRKSSTISPAKSSQAMYGKYNSQFDVKKRVEEVDRLLEKDLELDSSYAGSVVGVSVNDVVEEEDDDEDEEGDGKLFEGWLKDTSD